MTRPQRIDYPGAWHHAMNRSSGRRVAFKNDIDCEMFVELISELDERFAVEVHAYCIMGTHFHLLLRSREGRLSEAMQWLMSNFTRRANQIRRVDGSIFRGRFHSVSVGRRSHHVWLFRYINANPIDLGWDDDLSAYPWSGLGVAIGRGPDRPWMHTSYVEEYFNGDMNRFIEFVEDARNPRCSGGLGLRPSDVGVDGTLTIGDIIEAATLAAGFGPCRRSEADQRQAIALLASQLNVHGASDLGVALGIKTESAERVIRRARQRIQVDSEFQDLVRRITQLLAADHRCLTPVVRTSGV